MLSKRCDIFSVRDKWRILHARAWIRILSSNVQLEDNTNVSEYFPKMSEDYRRFTKITEDFRGGTGNVSII